MMDGYATHIPVLAWAAARAQRRWPLFGFVEYGCGWYSTPMLARMHPSRLAPPIVVYTSSGDWGKKFEDIADIRFVDDWQGFTLTGEYGLALLDNEELVVDRIKHLDNMVSCAHIVVMHDWRDGLGWEPPPGVRAEVYKRVGKPWTLILERE
jgi:hypothetical protein